MGLRAKSLKIIERASYVVTLSVLWLASAVFFLVAVVLITGLIQ